MDNASIIVPTCRLSGLCQKRGKLEEAESDVISAVALRIPVSIPGNTHPEHKAEYHGNLQLR